MRITIDVPDRTKCMSISIVYDGEDYQNMSMAADMRGTDELRDGVVFYLPREREKEN